MDLSYVLQVEALERQYLADRTAAVTAFLTNAGKDDEYTPPSWEERLAEFDAALAAEPARKAPVTDRDRANQVFLQAIGAA